MRHANSPRTLRLGITVATVTVIACGAEPSPTPEAPKPLLTMASRPRPEPSVKAPTSSEVPADLTPAEIAARSKNSIVVVLTPDGFGAGFAIGGNRVATCFHVVRGAAQIAVRTSDEVAHSVTAVLAYDPIGDLALLQVDGLRVAPLALGDSGELAQGEPVTVMGHPKGFEGSVSTGILSGVRDLGGLRLFQITAPISPGSSGGPVFNAQGQVIGVTHGLIPDSQELNFAIPIARLKRLLAERQTPTEPIAFAAATVEKQTDSAPPSPPETPSPASSGPQFPTDVAGFSFGMTAEQVGQMCPAAAFGESTATCPYPAVVLPFAFGPVTLTFSKGYVTAISLEPASRQKAEDALREKYGDAAAMRWDAAHSWQTAVRWPNGGIGGEQWEFEKGSMIRLGSRDGRRLFLTFVSRFYYETQRNNY
jgi:S1-C subfamily serine protease